MTLPTHNLARILLYTFSSALFPCTLAQPLHTDTQAPTSRSEDDKDMDISWSKYAIIAIAAVGGLLLLICAVFWYRKRVNPDRIRKREEHERQEDYVRRMMEANTKREATKSEMSLEKVSKPHFKAESAEELTGSNRV